MNSTIVSLIIALVSGSVVAVIGPFLLWKFDQRKYRREKRADLIRTVREYVTSDKFDYVAFCLSSMFFQIRPHLSNSLISKLRGTGEFIVIQGLAGGPGNAKEVGRPVTMRTLTGSPNSFAEEILTELSQIEVKWQLL